MLRRDIDADDDEPWRPHTSAPARHQTSEYVSYDDDWSVDDDDSWETEISNNFHNGSQGSLECGIASGDHKNNSYDPFLWKSSKELDDIEEKEASYNSPDPKKNEGLHVNNDGFNKETLGPKRKKAVKVKTYSHDRIHVVHLMSSVYHLCMDDALCDDTLLQNLIFSILPSELHRPRDGQDIMDYLHCIVTWFSIFFTVKSTSSSTKYINDAPIVYKTSSYLVKSLENRSGGEDVAMCIFVALCRSLGFICRIVRRIDTPSRRPVVKGDQPRAPYQEGSWQAKISSRDTRYIRSILKNYSFRNIIDLTNDPPQNIDLSNDGDDDEISAQFKLPCQSSIKVDNDVVNHYQLAKGWMACCWAELFLANGQWLRIIPYLNVIEKESDRLSSKFALYIIGACHGVVTDETVYYPNTWLSNRSERMPSVKLDALLKAAETVFCRLRLNDGEFKNGPLSLISFQSTVVFDSNLLPQKGSTSQPLPENVTQLKGHPTYIAECFLKRYEIFHPNSQPVGKLTMVLHKRKLSSMQDNDDSQRQPSKNEHIDIYNRNDVVVLRSARQWLVERGRCIIPSEYNTPAKIVAARVMNKANSSDARSTLHLFGEWQTEVNRPLEMVNGQLPKNSYGNIEILHPSMVPVGTVHIILPGAIAACKKLGIPAALAVTGFETTNGRSHPIYSGVVIERKFEETVVDAAAELSHLQIESIIDAHRQKVLKRWMTLAHKLKIKAYVDRQHG